MQAMKMKRRTPAALLCAAAIAAVAITAGAALTRQPEVERPNEPQQARQALVESLRENVQRQEQQLARQQRLTHHGHGEGEAALLRAEQSLATARELLFRISGENRAELIEIRTQLVARLENMLGAAHLKFETGLMSTSDMAELSNAVAEARVALFELRER